MEISVAIPYHGDRQKYTEQTIRNAAKRTDIKEVVVTLEPDSVFNLTHPKLKVFQNEKRLYVFRNKVEAVRRCSSPWAALIDSDNIVNSLYFNPLKNLPMVENVIYCPELGIPKLVYTEFVNRQIDKEHVSDRMREPRFDMLFNTMNYVFHRETWLAALEEAISDPYEPMSSDSKWINYHCLKAGMSMQVVDGMLYRHTVDKTGFYNENAAFDRVEGPKIFEQMKQWGNPIPRQEEKKSEWAIK